MQAGQTNWWIVVGLIVGLAGLDFLAAVLAREWTEHRQLWQLAGSAACFLGVFGLFVAGLRYTDLTILTFGWIVVLQAAVVLVDWARYDLAMTPARWAAVVGILALQSYLVLSPASSTSTADAPDELPGARGSVDEDDQPSASSAAS